jgi:AraC-like DNA-binding protein
MKYNCLASRDWLNAADRIGLNMLRCVSWVHERSVWNDFRCLPDHLAIFVERESLTVEVNGKRIVLNSGDAIWIFPGVFRRTKAKIGKAPEKDFRLHFQVGAGKVEKRLRKDCLVLRNAWEIEPLFRMLNMAWKDPVRYDEYFSKSLCMALASRFISLKDAGHQAAFSEGLMARLSSRVVDDPRRRTTPHELADIAGLSLDYFSRKLKKSCGLSPSAFIKNEKVRAVAAFLLESDASIKETAYLFGYDDESFFCRQFREVMQCSPLVYRRRQA